MTSTTGDSATVREEAAALLTAVLASASGNPALLGLPVFIVGSLALGMVLVGVVPAVAVGASLPIILASTSVGLILATIWAAAVGQSARWPACSASSPGSWPGLRGAGAGTGAQLVRPRHHRQRRLGPGAVPDGGWSSSCCSPWPRCCRWPSPCCTRPVDVALLLVLLGTTQASTGSLKAAWLGSSSRPPRWASTCSTTRPHRPLAARRRRWASPHPRPSGGPSPTTPGEGSPNRDQPGSGPADGCGTRGRQAA